MQNPNAIECISVYAVEIPFQVLGSRWSGRDKPQFLDHTVAIVETRAGLVGVGESCPIGAIFLPAFAADAAAITPITAPR